jgi:putative AlgH/UPF0301 family transcriptional regulator
MVTRALAFLIWLSATADAFLVQPVRPPGLGSSLTPVQSSTARFYRHVRKEDDQAETDWRLFRAKLVLQEHGIPVASSPDQTQQWAYQQGLLETGTLLVHSPFDGAQQELAYQRDTSMILDHPYLYRSVMLVLESNARETNALILNRPANVTLHEDGFKALLLFGGSRDSFHAPEDSRRVYCIHRNPKCKHVSKEVLSGLYMTTINSARRLIQDRQAQPADFLYISGYETLNTELVQEGIQSGLWKSITTDSLTLQNALQSDVWANLLSFTGTTPPPYPMTESDRTLDALLEEWSQACLFHGNSLNPAPPEEESFGPQIVPVDIEAGDFLRASSAAHAFLFDHQEFHKSLVLVLETKPTTAVAALLSYPTVEVEQTTGLPIRHGGNDGTHEVYCLHYVEAVGGRQIGNGFYQCSVDEAVHALRTGKAGREDLMLVRGYVEFPKHRAALDWVAPHAAPAVWQTLSQQFPLSPLALDHNVLVARDAWRTAGGSDSDDNKLCSLGIGAVKAWLASNLLDDGEIDARMRP